MEESGGGSPEVMKVEAREDLLQHVEAAERKMKAISVITIVVSFILIAAYISQLVIPLVSGERYVRVDLLDPGLISTQVILIILVGAWLYVGVLNYLFAARSGRRVREIRSLERELEKRITK